MTANAFVIFGANKDDIRIADLASANIRCALVTSTYAPNSTATGNALWANVSANEIPGVNGYTTGGATLTGTSLATAGNDGFKFSTGNAAWTGTGAGFAAFRYAVFYYLGTLWGQVNPLIGYILCDNTPADIPATTPANSPLTITCPVAGWFDAI
jgi:hypothetical protein